MNRKKKVWLWVFAGCLLLGAIIWLYPFPSNEKIEFSSYEQPLFYEGKRSEFHGVMKDERLYIPIEYVRQALNKPVVYDRNSDSMIATTVENVYQITIGEPFYKKNDRLIDITYRAVLETEENRWIAAEFLQTIYALSIKTYPNGAVHTFSQGFEKKIAKVKADVEEYELAVRSEPTVTSSYYTSLQGLDKVTVLMEKQGFYLIVTPSGYTGYVPKSSLQIKGTSTVQTQKEREKSEVPGEVTQPIHLAWDGIYTERANPEELPNRPGITVLSPTWFTLVNDKGEIHSRASASYVQSAHSNGNQVWALFSNGFDPELTSKVLPTYQKRTKMIHQLLRFAEKYNLDGINLDFENVYQEDGKWFTQFVRELTPRAHNQGLVISVDVTFISDSSQWSEFYERTELAEAADYLIVMAYDQHWATSPQAGSVASLQWVEQNLQELLEVVPKDHLLLGIPLYTRLWEENNGEVSSTALTMEEAERWVEDKGLTPELDESTGQEYVQKTIDGTTYKMWLENEISLKKRINLMEKYKLAGIASWSISFADREAWEFINEQLHEE